MLVLVLIFDLFCLGKKQDHHYQTGIVANFFWVALAAAFLFYVGRKGCKPALNISAYFMGVEPEHDNILCLFSSSLVFGKRKHFPCVIDWYHHGGDFVVIFITVGVALVRKFEWILLLFGAFLFYTGYKMFTQRGRSNLTCNGYKKFIELPESKIHALCRTMANGKHA